MVGKATDGNGILQMAKEDFRGYGRLQMDMQEYGRQPGAGTEDYGRVQE